MPTSTEAILCRVASMPRRSGSAQLARRIGSRIRTLRLEAGITQEALAWSCDLAKAYLSQVEAGKRIPSVPALISIARRIGVDPVDLLAIDPKNATHAVLDALRRFDREAVEAGLRAAGLYRQPALRHLRVAEPTPPTRRRRAKT